MTPPLDAAAARQALETALREHRQEFEAFFLARFLELHFTYPGDGCVLRFPVRDYLFNPVGSLHGGIIATLLDMSMGHLLKHRLGAAGVTIEIKTQFFAPVRGPQAHCEAKFLHIGRGTCFMESRLIDGDGTLAAAATSTWRVLKPEASGAPGAPGTPVA